MDHAHLQCARLLLLGRGRRLCPSLLYRSRRPCTAYNLQHAASCVDFGRNQRSGGVDAMISQNVWSNRCGHALE